MPGVETQPQARVGGRRIHEGGLGSFILQNLGIGRGGAGDPATQSFPYQRQRADSADSGSFLQRQGVTGPTRWIKPAVIVDWIFTVILLVLGEYLTDVQPHEQPVKYYVSDPSLRFPYTGREGYLCVLSVLVASSYFLDTTLNFMSICSCTQSERGHGRRSRVVVSARASYHGVHSQLLSVSDSPVCCVLSSGNVRAILSSAQASRGRSDPVMLISRYMTLNNIRGYDDQRLGGLPFLLRISCKSWSDG